MEHLEKQEESPVVSNGNPQLGSRRMTDPSSFNNLTILYKSYGFHQSLIKILLYKHALQCSLLAMLFHARRYHSRCLDWGTLKP